MKLGRSNWKLQRRNGKLCRGCCEGGESACGFPFEQCSPVSFLFTDDCEYDLGAATTAWRVRLSLNELQVTTTDLDRSWPPTDAAAFDSFVENESVTLLEPCVIEYTVAWSWVDGFGDAPPQVPIICDIVPGVFRARATSYAERLAGPSAGVVRDQDETTDIAITRPPRATQAVGWSSGTGPDGEEVLWYAPSNPPSGARYVEDAVLNTFGSTPIGRDDERALLTPASNIALPNILVLSQIVTNAVTVPRQRVDRDGVGCSFVGSNEFLGVDEFGSRVFSNGNTGGYYQSASPPSDISADPGSSYSTAWSFVLGYEATTLSQRGSEAGSLASVSFGGPSNDTYIGDEATWDIATDITAEVTPIGPCSVG